MKIWIPGAQGMLGSQLMKMCSERQLETLGTDIVGSPISLDITHLEQVLHFVSSQQITHIINCAAYTQVDKAETDRHLAYQVNVTGSGNLGAASKEFGIPVIHFSTDYVFDGKASSPYQEEHPAAPINYYGLTKWEGEKALFAESSKVCVIRTSWLYGLSGKNFVETMLRLMQRNEVLRVVADQVGRPTFCKDLCEATLELLNHSGVYHFANSGQVSWHRFAEEIRTIASKLEFPLKVKEILPITTHEYPTAANRPAYSTLDTQKIEKTIGRAPRPWETALEDYLKQYQCSSQYHQWLHQKG